MIVPVHSIGALSLDTLPLKYSMKSEAASWKAQFAKNLHKKGAEELKASPWDQRNTEMPAYVAHQHMLRLRA